MRAKLIGGPPHQHGTTAYLPDLPPGALQSKHAFLRTDDAMYVPRMWLHADGRPEIVLVDVTLDLGEAFDLALGVMAASWEEPEGDTP